MLVTKLEAITKKRTKVYLEEEYAFILYPQDLKKYHIAEGKEVSQDTLSSIYFEVVLRRAKQKAMQLLMHTDYSEYGMRQRLQKDLYPMQAVDDTIRFLYSYHYLDDARYTEHYILSKGSAMSYRELKQKLRAQGIDDTMIQEIYDSMDIDDLGVLREQLKKKLSGKQQLDEKERTRLISYFMRRGFSYHQIVDSMKILAGSEADTAYDLDNEEW